MSLCPFPHFASSGPDTWELERFVILCLSLPLSVSKRIPFGIFHFHVYAVIRLSNSIERSLLAIQGLAVSQSEANLSFAWPRGEASSLFESGLSLVNVDFDVHFQELSN